jgi:hypothetical protein
MLFSPLRTTKAKQEAQQHKCLTLTAQLMGPHCAAFLQLRHVEGNSPSTLQGASTLAAAALKPLLMSEKKSLASWASIAAAPVASIVVSPP